MIQYEDFSIKIEPQRDDVYPVIVLRSPAGEARSSFHLPFDPDDLGDLLVDLGQTVRGTGQRPMRETAPGATRTRPQQIGDQLFNALFAGPVRSLLDQSLGMIRERQKGLRIKLHIDPEDASLARLASLPWELMYRKETRDFLNLSRYTPILRYLDVQVPYVPLALEPPLRILVVISNPVDCAPLNLEHERDQIERTWARQENVEVRFLETPSISALQDRLEREPFHALHYMGHGGFDRSSGSGVLLLEDETRCGIPVDGRTLGVLLRDVPSLRLVFLNACETARVTKQVGLDPFAGVAAAIVMAGVPAVVAMQFPISDVAAIRFAGRFYPLIALGEPVDYAVAEGRRAIRVAESDTMEWATPILFMRAPDGVLFKVAEAHRVQRRRPQAPLLDREIEQRLEQLYIAGLSAFWLEEWDRACHNFQEIVDEQPDYKDAAARLAEAERKWHQNELYREAQDARQAGSWTIVLNRLQELVTEDPGYKDSAALLDLARRQKRLADLYGQARQLHQAGQWPAVVRVFDQIAALDPDYPDPDDLLATARQETARLERQAELNDLYRRAVLEMDAGRWQQAQQLLARLQQQEPGYREADRLLAKVQAELTRQEAERQRQEQIAALYDRAANWAGAGQWAQALAEMDEIRALDAGFADPQGLAARARAEVDRGRKLEALYSQAQVAQDSQDWSQARAALQAVVDEDAGYRDAAALLAEVEVQQELAGLYAQAQEQHRAGEWQVVVETFDRIATLEPGYADPDGLLPSAERSLAEQQRRAELDDLYERAARAMEAGDWTQARPFLARIQGMEPGYRGAEQLLDRAEKELEQVEAERQRREQVATLYEQAQSLARARQWRPALVKMDEIRALDAGFTDTEGIAARAREQVAQEEAEARRQNELAALYAEAVHLLRAEQYQEALQKWGEVQALDPHYPDRKKVQATARKKLASLAKPATKRRLPRWAMIIAGTLIVAVVTVAAVFMIGTLSTAPPTPGRIPAYLADGTAWQWSDGSAMVYVPASAFWMGSGESDPNANPDELPQHVVNLDAFWIDRTEVTNAQYRRCVKDGGCSKPSQTTSYLRETYYDDSQYDDYPIIHVGWEQANTYCAWAGKRLPTEAEWEKAARGPDGRIYPWGNNFDGTLANFCDASCSFPQKTLLWDDGYRDTAPVGSYKGGASPYGAWDMAGNVHEWTTSLARPYPYDAADGREDQGATGQRVVRGGSLGGGQPGMRTASRESRDQAEDGIDLGFRCVRSASEPAQASGSQPDTTPAPLSGRIAFVSERGGN
jgi:formylglycine-generating enzyme required for sulfatase activity